eukprot:499221-Amphidinium_carterae.1
MLRLTMPGLPQGKRAVAANNAISINHLPWMYLLSIFASACNPDKPEVEVVMLWPPFDYARRMADPKSGTVTQRDKMVM